MIIYSGKSQLDGQPIVAIATGLDKSANPKTGNMVQIWILADNGIKPHENVKSGADVSICGDCKHRPANGGTCYVKTFQAPRSIYAAYLRGRYDFPSLDDIAEKLSGKIVRLGAYGDPAAVPVEIWDSILSKAAAWTGYTHQWLRDKFDARLMRYTMASVDNETEAEQAKTRGYRYFRVKRVDQPKLAQEVVCPASAEAGHKVTCSQCLACGGTNGRKSSIVINAHGASAKRFAG